MPSTAWLWFPPEQGDNPRTDQESHCAAASSGLLAKPVYAKETITLILHQLTFQLKFFSYLSGKNIFFIVIKDGTGSSV